MQNKVKYLILLLIIVGIGVLSFSQNTVIPTKSNLQPRLANIDLAILKIDNVATTTQIQKTGLLPKSGISEQNLIGKVSENIHHFPRNKMNSKSTMLRQWGGEWQTQLLLPILSTQVLSTQTLLFSEELPDVNDKASGKQGKSVKGQVTANKPDSARSTKKVSYSRDILPIFSDTCFHCHGPDEKSRKAKLQLNTAESATQVARSGERAIVPGKPELSELIHRIESNDEDHMPPKNSPRALTKNEIELLKQWILEGANYEQHWAFTIPQKSKIPTVANNQWCRNPIDYFILAKMAEHSLSPSKEADRSTLARRVALDLTGLPPSLEEVKAFVEDKSLNAYERFVDRVLQSPAFGERWASIWLDLARYGDSNGYASDHPRTIWKYRDWVIEALNQNEPYNQFTIDQLAGDMLPNPTKNQLVATGFNRNTLTNDEGGTDDEEFRVAAVVDRVNTTMQVWMGLTFACAECHNHKFDPFSQEEYFKLYAIFNQSEDNDQRDNRPYLELPTPEQVQRKKQLKKESDQANHNLQQLKNKLDADMPNWEKNLDKSKLPKDLKELQQMPKDKRSKNQNERWQKYYYTHSAQAKEYEKLEKASQNKERELERFRVGNTPIMRELPKERQRKTNIFLRGNFLAKGKEVQPGLPSLFANLKNSSTKDASLTALSPMGNQDPKSHSSTPYNRLDFARWLVSRDNPLTARVAVNRFWEQIFGQGLVTTSEDFGLRGKFPTHAELLDYLAVSWMEELNWDIKKLLRLMVTSATYRQQSVITPQLQNLDPENHWYARGPRFRISAETVRDQSLAIAGLLARDLYGPPARPYRPHMGQNSAFSGSTDWETSKGKDRYRRALYTEWRRSTPYPSLVNFDLNSRTVCTISRPKTNTPIQALTTLNDPVYIECAQSLARRMIREGGKSVSDRLVFGFKLTLLRDPEERELQKLQKLFAAAMVSLQKEKDQGLHLATEPLGPLPPNFNLPETAAYVMVANVLLNLDEFFMKR